MRRKSVVAELGMSVSWVDSFCLDGLKTYRVVGFG